MGGFITTQGHGEMSGPGLSGFMARMQPQAMLMSETLDTTKGREYRAIQRWSCPPLAATLGRAGLAPYRLKRSGERVLALSGQHNRGHPVLEHR